MVFVDQWRNDQSHGKGQITYPAGNGRKGKWKFGKKHGKGFRLTVNDQATPDEWWYGFSRTEEG